MIVKYYENLMCHSDGSKMVVIRVLFCISLVYFIEQFTN